jgi:hypothetical protein
MQSMQEEQYINITIGERIIWHQRKHEYACDYDEYRKQMSIASDDDTGDDHTEDTTITIEEQLAVNVANCKAIFSNTKTISEDIEHTDIIGLTDNDKQRRVYKHLINPKASKINSRSLYPYLYREVVGIESLSQIYWASDSLTSNIE